jgi:hypothetical protein
VVTVPDNRVLMVGAGDDYLPAGGCPVAIEKYGNGQYMAHIGDPDSFLVAEARVKDGSAAVRVVLWRCVFCHATLIGLGLPEGELGSQDFTWMEHAG